LPKIIGDAPGAWVSSPHLARLAMVNYYKILKISPNATAAEIKSAYRRLAREIHPDVNGDSEEATREFAIVVKAYEVLSDKQKRSRYDRQFRKAQAARSIHNTDSVFHSDNPYASRLRQMAIEHRYNKIVDRMMEAERKETLALQKVIFPTVALFVSTCFVAIFKPLFWTNSEFIGRVILLTLFIISVFHLIKLIRYGFRQYTYKSEKLHDSILEAIKPEDKPYSRKTAVSFLLIGVGISLGIGLIIGNLLQATIALLMPRMFSPTLQPEFIFYPPIFVLLVDLMHSFAAKVDY
jgi:curved DNA-binding protein CbpA